MTIEAFLARVPNGAWVYQKPITMFYIETLPMYGVFYHGDVPNWLIGDVNEYTILPIQCIDTIEPIPSRAGNMKYLIDGEWKTFEQVMA